LGTDPMKKQQNASQLPQDDKALDILKLEYTSLLNLYTHTENSINGIFNFYLTLLSAIAGAMIVLFQINSTNLFESYPSVIGLLIFVVLIGVIVQDSVVNKNIDLSNLTRNLNLLKYRMFHNYPVEMSYVSYFYNFWEADPPEGKTDTVSRIHKKLWWLFPLGTYQLFIAIMDSLALAFLTITIAQLISGNAVSLDGLVTSGALVFIVSFQLNTTYARLKHRRGLESFRVMSKTVTHWSKIVE
jgi:hypothetical protein